MPDQLQSRKKTFFLWKDIAIPLMILWIMDLYMSSLDTIVPEGI